MPNSKLLYCATDKEIFDMMMASKQRITEGILLAFARERGIFCSPRDSREALVHYLSVLHYTDADLDTILSHRASSQRTEKRTSIKLGAVISLEDIKAVCSEYREAVTGDDERVVTRQNGTNAYTATVNYSELDHSKTRLLQRREKEAEIEFFIKDNETIVRMPASPKAASVVEKLRQSLNARVQQAIPSDTIELSHVNTAEARTTFFTSLITSLPGYRLENVTDIKVESQLSRDLDDDGDEDETEAEIEEKIIERSMLSMVENIALKGTGLLAAPEYQQLKEKGFFITNVVWKSRQLVVPYDIVEFDAGFSEPRQGKGFRYNVRGIYRNVNGAHTSTLRQISKEDKPPYFDIIENTARQVLLDLTNGIGVSETVPS